MKQKIHIKHIFISHLNTSNKSKSIYSISMLTDKLKYAEYEIGILQTCLTKCLTKRIMQLMQPFAIDKNTTVVFHESVEEFSPFHLYFIILHQHIPFTLQHGLTTADLLRRICAFHHTYAKNKKSSNITEMQFNKIWKKLVQHSPCSWIDSKIDKQLNQHGKDVERRKRLARVGAYYMVIRRYLMDIHNRSINKKIYKNSNANAQKIEIDYQHQNSQSQNCYFDITV